MDTRRTNMSNDKLIEWKRKGEHLPKFLRDSESQTQLMQLLLHYYSSTDEKNPLHTHSPAILKNYLFNVFLDYFADNGITLQPIRSNTVEFLDFEQELKNYQDYEAGVIEKFELQPITNDKYDAIEKYRQALLFLPEFMNTFDKFKYVFRGLHRNYGNVKEYANSLSDIDYQVGTIFIIDFFLWFCAEYGYKLQNSKKKIEFKSTIDETL